MKLTLVISSLNSGGAERVLSTLANSWCAQGRQVTILTTHDGGRTPDYTLAPGIRLISLDPMCGGLKRQIAIVRGIRHQIKSNTPDAIVSFLSNTNVMVLIATRGLNIPVVVSERLDPSTLDVRPIWSMLRRRTYRWADTLVAQTSTAAQYFESIISGKIRVIPNPVFELTTDPGSDDPVSFDGKTILAIGRLHPQKGFDVLIHAMVALRKQEPDWQLVILGEGNSREKLGQVIKEQGQEGKIHLQGRVRNPWPWLIAADIFVMSSRNEGFPNALCEAMVAGLPVLSTDCPSGPSDLIIDGQNGLLVPVEDIDALAEGMLRLTRSSNLRNDLGSRAKNIRTLYNLPKILALWDEALMEVVNSGSSIDYSERLD